MGRKKAFWYRKPLVRHLTLKCGLIWAIPISRHLQFFRTLRSLDKTFSWHGPNPSWLSLAFINDWRVLSLGCLALTKLCPLGTHLAQQMALHFCSICWVDEIKTNNTELLTYFIKKEKYLSDYLLSGLNGSPFSNPKNDLKQSIYFYDRL